MPHIHELIDFCVETFIVYNHKVLLRKHDKYKIWLSVGGHIELHEDPNQAAIREIKEEVGLNIKLYQEKGNQPDFKTNKKSLIPPQYINRHRINDTHEHVAFVYFAEAATDNLSLSDIEVSEQTHWFSKEELEKNNHNIQPDIQFYALKALKAYA